MWAWFKIINPNIYIVSQKWQHLSHGALILGHSHGCWNRVRPCALSKLPPPFHHRTWSARWEGHSTQPLHDVSGDLSAFWQTVTPKRQYGSPWARKELSGWASWYFCLYSICSQIFGGLRFALSRHDSFTNQKSSQNHLSLDGWFVSYRSSKHPNQKPQLFRFRAGLPLLTGRWGSASEFRKHWRLHSKHWRH